MRVKGSRKPRICRFCGETEEIQFYLPHATECKKCLCARTSRAQNGNSSFHRRRHLRRKYGLTVEQYENMLAEQNGLCALCGLPPDETDLQKILVVDHDHETNQIRGLIHGRCNALIGYAREDVRVLTCAIGYVTRNTNHRVDYDPRGELPRSFRLESKAPH